MRNEPYRDCKAWNDQKLELSTTSNEASKLYDACLTQYVGWYDDQEFGGLDKTSERLFQSDPDFVLGNAFTLGLQLLGTSDTILTNPSLKESYASLKELAAKHDATLTEREKLHVKAISHWAEGKPSSACEVWEDILVEWPLDMHALKMSHDTYFYLGDSLQLRDSVARVLPFWERERPPLKSYLYGFYAFGLQENNHFQKAELYARKGLEENPHDGWSTHGLAHVFEMEARTNEGIKFMQDTVSDWERCNLLACHNYWHVALYHLENEDYEVAANILEKELLSRAQDSKAMLDLVDCCSLSWRINMLNPTSLKNSHVSQLYGLCKPYCKQHVTTFNDAHFMMAFTCRNSGEDGDERLPSVNELLESYCNDDIPKGEMATHPTIGSRILKAFVSFKEEKYAKVVELLEPLRYRITPIGGSNAQRDLFNLMLIVSCLKSTCPRDRRLAKVLINERDALKGKTTKLTQTLDMQAQY